MSSFAKVATAAVLACAGPVGVLAAVALLSTEEKVVDQKFEDDVNARVREKEVEAEADKRISTSNNHK